MKLYQKQEWELLKSIYHPWEDDFEGIDWSEDFSAIYRLRRLLDSIKGFHSVRKISRIQSLLLLS